ncbi:exopolysaccharide biosynthesis protein [Octadecabacter sp. G9-8]|uniref:Exopolysaccharide biosynthesis protein n=1 Tax=Octadecabacter dasysiphoniae TaxID=2909341 RepID=A0ABS9CUW3_9RHOB|nr:exopolysaccharide biosynthesis protein [Octadecabacter dasysiphoniae]MCF2870609.1 exopolysaccharide biosynthesis protein [Octadecabacter dasysiphoniae]
MTASPDDVLAISQQLDHLAKDAPSDTVTLDWVLHQMNERAFGLFLLVLALPCCIPFLYGIPQVVALPLMFISAQILLGRTSPWLPTKLGARTISKDGLQNLADRAGPWLRKIEGISKPRLTALSRPPMDRIVGLGLVLFSASILVPLPGTNSVPGLAVVIISMGLLQRDGLLILFGLVLGTVWITTLIVAGATLASLLKGWIGL